MKLLTTKNTYKRPNCELKVSTDLKHVEAHSYSWWGFVHTDKAGNVIFLDSKYSNTTTSQQSDVKDILNRLDIRPHLTLYRTLEPLKDYSSDQVKDAIRDEIRLIRKEISGLIKKIKTKGSWKKTNAERRESIKEMLFRIKDLRNFRDNYLDQKPYPLKKQSIKEHCLYYDGSINKSEIKAINQYKKRWFKKPSGKYDYQGLRELIQGISYLYQCPESIDKIKLHFGLKGNDSIMPILKYRFTRDLENMLPDQDNPDFEVVQKAMRRMKIGREGFNLLSLDKLHTFLINHQNRKTYVPKEPVALPISPILEALESQVEDLKLIKTDRDLRAEGRQQGHCIGSRHYLDQLRQGYQAFRYKGHTFFLNPNLSLVEAHGKHNSVTPSEYVEEIFELINGKLEVAS